MYSAPTGRIRNAGLGEVPLPGGWEIVDGVLQTTDGWYYQGLRDAKGGLAEPSNAVTVEVDAPGGGRSRLLDAGPIATYLQAKNDEAAYDARSNSRMFDRGDIIDGNGNVVGHYDYNPAAPIVEDPFVQAMQDAIASGDQSRIAAVAAQYGHPLPAAAPAPGPAYYLRDGLTYGADGTPLPASDPRSYNALSDLYRQIGVTPGAVTPEVLKLIQLNPDLVEGLPPDQAAILKRTLRSLAGQGALPTAIAPASGSSAPVLTPAGPTLLAPTGLPPVLLPAPSASGFAAIARSPIAWLAGIGMVWLFATKRARRSR